MSMTDEPTGELTVAQQLTEARQLVEDEREHIDNKLAAFDQFATGVSRLSADPMPHAAGSATRDGVPESVSTALDHGTGSDDRIETVRSLFAETVRPYSIEDVAEPEPLLVTIREELGAKIALSLSPSTDRPFTAELQAAIQSATDQCQAELEAMEQGLAVEESDLKRVSELQTAVADCLERDQLSLPMLDFETLRDRHEKISTFQHQCEVLAADRQSTLHETTNHAVTADLSQWPLVEYLYQPLAIDYPVLSTTARLVERCENRQRTIREHLTQCH